MKKGLLFQLLWGEKKINLKKEQKKMNFVLKYSSNKYYRSYSNECSYLEISEDNVI